MSNFDGVVSSPVNLELIPSGLQPAALVALLDHGTHEGLFLQDGKNEKRRQREIGLYYALTGLAAQPLLAMTVNRSFVHNSNLVKWLSGCLGRVLGAGEPARPTSMLGKPVLVMIEHRISKKSGKPYAAIKTVMPPMTGQAAPALKLTPFSWEIGDGPIPAVVGALPYVFGLPAAQRIKDSPEYQAWAAIHSTNPTPGAGNSAPTGDPDTPF
jgi:hypothetical protein